MLAGRIPPVTPIQVCIKAVLTLTFYKPILRAHRRPVKQAEEYGNTEFIGRPSLVGLECSFVGKVHSGLEASERAAR